MIAAALIILASGLKEAVKDVSPRFKPPRVKQKQTIMVITMLVKYLV